MAQVLGPMIHMLTQKTLRAPDFGLAEPRLLQPFGTWTGRGKTLGEQGNNSSGWVPLNLWGDLV